MNKGDIWEVLQSCLLASDEADINYLIDKGFNPELANMGFAREEIFGKLGKTGNDEGNNGEEKDLIVGKMVYYGILRYTSVYLGIRRYTCVYLSYSVYRINIILIRDRFKYWKRFRYFIVFHRQYISNL